MVTVILIEPEWASNVGAVARVMANFGVSELVLINPKCNINELDAIKRAKHALPILKKARIESIEYLDNFDYLVATTSKIGSDYHILRSPINPRECAKVLSRVKSSRIGLVFGREGDGLYNSEIERCDFVISIPTSLKYSSMNLSHAVGIILYELYVASEDKKLGDNIRPIGEKEKEHLLRLIDDIADNLEFSTKEKRETQRLTWKRFISRGFLSRRESFALFGFFRKILDKIIK